MWRTQRSYRGQGPPQADNSCYRKVAESDFAFGTFFLGNKHSKRLAPQGVYQPGILPNALTKPEGI